MGIKKKVHVYAPKKSDAKKKTVAVNSKPKTKKKRNEFGDTDAIE